MVIYRLDSVLQRAGCALEQRRKKTSLNSLVPSGVLCLRNLSQVVFLMLGSIADQGCQVFIAKGIQDMTNRTSDGEGMITGALEAMFTRILTPHDNRPGGLATSADVRFLLEPSVSTRNHAHRQAVRSNQYTVVSNCVCSMSPLNNKYKKQPAPKSDIT